jgi:hypothetical protein
MTATPTLVCTERTVLEIHGRREVFRNRQAGLENADDSEFIEDLPCLVAFTCNKNKIIRMSIPKKLSNIF